MSTKKISNHGCTRMDTDKPDKLKPCPFCGSQDLEFKIYPELAVVCQKCCAVGPFSWVQGSTHVQADMIKSWNARPDRTADKGCSVEGFVRFIKWAEREYDFTSYFCGCGCDHGFKPAADCINEGCEQAEMHRILRRVLESNNRHDPCESVSIRGSRKSACKDGAE